MYPKRFLLDVFKEYIMCLSKNPASRFINRDFRACSHRIMFVSKFRNLVVAREKLFRVKVLFSL